MAKPDSPRQEEPILSRSTSQLLVDLESLGEKNKGGKSPRLVPKAQKTKSNIEVVVQEQQVPVGRSRSDFQFDLSRCKKAWEALYSCTLLSFTDVQRKEIYDAESTKIRELKNYNDITYKFRSSTDNLKSINSYFRKLLREERIIKIKEAQLGFIKQALKKDPRHSAKIEKKYLKFLKEIILPIIDKAPLEIKSTYKDFSEAIAQVLSPEFGEEEAQIHARSIAFNSFMLSVVIPIIQNIPESSHKITKKEITLAWNREIDFRIERNILESKDPAEENELIDKAVVERIEKEHKKECKTLFVKGGKLLIKSFSIGGRASELEGYLMMFQNTLRVEDSREYRKHQEIIQTMKDKFFAY